MRDRRALTVTQRESKQSDIKNTLCTYHGALWHGTQYRPPLPLPQRLHLSHSVLLSPPFSFCVHVSLPIAKECNGCQRHCSITATRLHSALWHISRCSVSLWGTLWVKESYGFGITRHFNIENICISSWKCGAPQLPESFRGVGG